MDLSVAVDITPVSWVRHNVASGAHKVQSRGSADYNYLFIYLLTISLQTLHVKPIEVKTLYLYIGLI